MRTFFSLLIFACALFVSSSAAPGVLYEYDEKLGAFVPQGTPEELAALRASQEEIKRICSKMGTFDKYYQECLLSELPKTKTDLAAAEAMEFCRQKYPCNIIKKQKSGMLGVTSAHECFVKYGAGRSSVMAAGNIRTACYDLYVDK